MATAAVGLAGGPIGLGITAGVTGLSSVLSVFKQHELRYRNAKNENDAVGVAVGVFDTDLKAIFSALNSGQITQAQALQYLEASRQAWWSYAGQFQGNPGVAMVPCKPRTAPNACAGPPSNSCDKTCTSACCVGCNNIEPTVANAAYVINQGGGKVNVCKVFPSPGIYGFAGREGYSVTYTKPAGTIGTTVSGFLNSIGIGSTTPENALPVNLQNFQAAQTTKTLQKSAVGIATFVVVGVVGLFVLPKLTH